MSRTLCFDIFRKCYEAMHEGTLIKLVSKTDKEFHFQNWCNDRIAEATSEYEPGTRNAYPDFTLVNYPEGYEIKGLKYPGRTADFDANSNLPTGKKNGRTIFYIFGRYPEVAEGHKTANGSEYPVLDLVLCHGDFLCAEHSYVHKNKHVKGFGTYGDIMIRDRKMYVVPTPFALTEGTDAMATLIVPNDYEAPEGFVKIGTLNRVESNEMLVGYTFNLQSNEIESNSTPNPNAGKIHEFAAYRLESQGHKGVTLRSEGEMNETLSDISNDLEESDNGSE